MNAEIADTIRYATANEVARALIDPADLQNPRIYPPEEVIAKCETMIELGDVARLYDEAWTTIQAA